MDWDEASPHAEERPTMDTHLDEVSVRQALIATSRRLLSEWDAGQDWRGRKEWFDFDTSDVDIKREFEDFRSLAAAWAFLDSFIDAMNHGFDRLDNLSWDDAVSVLRDIVGRLEKGLPVQNEAALSYLRANTTSGCNPFRRLFGGSIKQ